jgi:hypothetical protein
MAGKEKWPGADSRRNENGSVHLQKKHGRHAPAVFMGILPFELEAQ